MRDHPLAAVRCLERDHLVPPFSRVRVSFNPRVEWALIVFELVEKNPEDLRRHRLLFFVVPV